MTFRSTILSMRKQFRDSHFSYKSMWNPYAKEYVKFQCDSFLELLDYLLPMMHEIYHIPELYTLTEAMDLFRAYERYCITASEPFTMDFSLEGQDITSTKLHMMEAVPIPDEKTQVIIVCCPEVELADPRDKKKVDVHLFNLITLREPFTKYLYG